MYNGAAISLIVHFASGNFINVTVYNANYLSEVKVTRKP